MSLNYANEALTGIRPTADLTIANYIGAIKPILEMEQTGAQTSVFLAELHAATTHAPREVAENARQLGRTLIASGVQGDIYSQRQIEDLVGVAEISIRGLVSVNRLLGLPTLKEKVKNTDNTGSASVGLALYPMMMSADIILARPQVVPTGKDQKSHLEITNDLIDSFNSQHKAGLPRPEAYEMELANVLSLDGSGRKMSKSIPSGAVFLDDTPEIGHRKIKRAVTASEPGEAMDTAVDNMLFIARSLSSDQEALASLEETGVAIKGGDKKMGMFKDTVGTIVAEFLSDIQEARNSVSDEEVKNRIHTGSGKARVTATETYAHMRDAMWGN